MDYPARKRKPGTAVPGPDEEADRLELRLAEYSAPRGEEAPGVSRSMSYRDWPTAGPG